MPQEITAYQANDGSIHATACKAATCDLEALVKASPLNENQPYAKKLCEWLTNQATDIIDVLTAYRDACPIENKGEAASKQPEGTHTLRPLICHQCGTVEGTVHPFRHIPFYIPAGVYWGKEHSNFYDAADQNGMGEIFYKRWEKHQGMFPFSAEQAQLLARGPAKPANYKKSPIPEGHDPNCDCHKSGDFADCDCLPEIRR